MAVARGAWALLAMQTTCYTAHIEKKSKPNKKHNFWQNKNENKKQNSYYQCYSYVVHGNKTSLTQVRPFQYHKTMF